MKVDNERLNAFWGEAGHFLLDVAKLIIGGVLLAGIMKEDIDRSVLYGWGTVFVILFTAFGFTMVWWSKSKKKG